MVADSNRTFDVLLPYALEEPYSYRVPAGMTAEPGAYVLVPLGTRSVIGVVWGEGGAPGGKALRDVEGVFELPAMPETHRRFIDWVASYYLEPPGNVLRMALRAQGVFAGARERIAYRASGKPTKRPTAQRMRVLTIASEGLPLMARELQELAGVGASVVKGLIAESALEAVALPADAPFVAPDLEAGRLALSREQEEAARELRALVAKRSAGVALLDGVTGSGKTEVYFEAMTAAIAGGGQVLLLLPEIALTQQFLGRVERRFGLAPGHWHSDVKPRERERVWRGVATGQAKIVVGARSALFLPWQKLGLIVVDEEHEPAYKQEDGVPYHARDMAVVYASLAKCPAVLSSATPSLESLVNAQKGKYLHVRLKDRHGRAELPKTSLIDMRTEKLEPGRWIAERLADQVKATLAAGDQVLLFLNRRGYAPLTLCRACGYRLNCPQCSAALIEHRFRRQLLCHWCGHTEPVPIACPQCHTEGKLVPCGPGIERVAEEVKQRFPEARLAILSSDLTRGVNLRSALAAVAKGEVNLVVGTQLVAKGHNFPHLTLVGVVDADLALETGDPRGGERTWAIISQVAGRAGRGVRPGEALVQTYLPEHPLMTSLVSGDRDGYFAQEMAIRASAGLPPYRRLAGVVVSGTDAGQAERLAKALRARAPSAQGINVLGPAPAPIHLLRGRHRWRLLAKADPAVNLQAFLRAWLAGLKPKGSLRIDVDVDPYSFL
jgi:primosomal protein N' (replication factor Y)